MTNVYKSRHFIAKNESVRIPDYEYEKFDQNPLPSDESNETEEALVYEPDTSEKEQESNIEVLPETNDTVEDEPIIITKPEEELPKAKIVTAEELKIIYEQNLKELAASVAEQAYYDALNKKKAQLKDCIVCVQNLMDEMVTAHRQFIEEYTNELKYMAVDIAEKMILEKISQDDLILQRLVLQTINSVKNAEWLNVEISERLVGLVDSIKKELEKPEYNGRAFVFPVAGSDSVCRVITNEGTVVSSIEVQANNLRKAFAEFEQQQQ